MITKLIGKDGVSQIVGSAVAGCVTGAIDGANIVTLAEGSMAFCQMVWWVVCQNQQQM